MSVQDLLYLLPLILMSASSTLVLLVIAFFRHYVVTVILSLVGLFLTFASCFGVAIFIPKQVTPLLAIDGLAIFFVQLICVASGVVVILSYNYFKDKPEVREEFYPLLLLGASGACVMVCSNHFASFFLGLEILNISLYALIAYTRYHLKSLEAGFKYLILAATSDAFLLFGMALVYFQTGSMGFPGLFAKIGVGATVGFSGICLMIVGLGFKLALVPFHMWTPDVYEGASAPVTAFIATVSKGAAFVVLYRLFGSRPELAPIFLALSVITMFVGNFLALLQNNLKRLLAYSSIADMGYLLLALIAASLGERIAVTALTFYLAAYFFTVLAAFGVISMLSTNEGDADNLDEYRGLGWQRPWLGGVLAGMLLSLAGIPLTAGFLAKFYLVAAGVGSALWFLVITLVINSAISVYYYLRVIIVLYTRPVSEPNRLAAAPPSLTGGLVLAFLTIAVLWLGIYPSPFLHVLQAALSKV